MAKLDKLIDRHLAFYDRREKKSFDKARRFYRGDYWSSSGSSDAQDIASSLLCSKNLVYAIADTAVSALLGPNPAVAGNPMNPDSQEVTPAVNGLMEWIFRSNNMRRRASTALIDAVLCKRGIFKTGWSSSEDRPIIRVVDPGALFFDLTVRDTDDIRYWLEATVMPWSEFQARVDSGRYKSDKLDDIRPDRFPKWMLDKNQTTDPSTVRDAFKWVTVWEYYDRENNKVQHYVKQANAVVFEDTIDYIPYSMFSLNHSGVDCLGLSEVQLILNQQETVNDLLTHWKQIVYLMIPRILYDAGRITEEDLNKAVEASAGAFVGVAPENSETLRNLGSLFYQLPMPEAPAGVKEFVARQEEDASFVSALAEAARGQVTGARTATEMAIIDAQMKNRLATREGHVNDALEDVASKAFYLCRKYMKEEKMVRVAGNRQWDSVRLENIRDVDIEFEMVSHNPIRKNPAVMIESMMQLLPFLSQSQDVDTRRLTEEIVQGMGLPNKVMVPKEEAEAAMAQAQQQQLQQSGAINADQAAQAQMAIAEQLMGAEGGEAPVGPEGAPAEESLAAGGGAPIREGAAPQA